MNLPPARSAASAGASHRGTPDGEHVAARNRFSRRLQRRANRTYGGLLAVASSLLVIALLLPLAPDLGVLRALWLVLLLLGLLAGAAEVGVHRRFAAARTEAERPLPLMREEPTPIDFDATWKGGGGP